MFKFDSTGIHDIWFKMGARVSLSCTSASATAMAMAMSVQKTVENPLDTAELEGLRVRLHELIAPGAGKLSVSSEMQREENMICWACGNRATLDEYIWVLKNEEELKRERETLATAILHAGAAQSGGGGGGGGAEKPPEFQTWQESEVASWLTRVQLIHKLPPLYSHFSLLFSSHSHPHLPSLHISIP